MRFLGAGWAGTVVTDAYDGYNELVRLVARLLDAAFRQDEDQNADRRRFENRAMLDKLCLSLARLMQAHPHYARRRTSVAGIRKMIGWETEENFGRLLEVVDRSAFEATVEGLRLTAADRRRYQKVLEEAEDDLW